MAPTAVFLSHSSKDAAVARRLAKDLRTNGVGVWYAEWEIRPGDSLRRKIDEGVDRATHFLVLLSPNSLTSEWVQTELDAGMVKRIEGNCRLIPVVLGVDDFQVPVILRGLLWVRLEPYEEGLRKLIETCHDVATKPPLGSPPRWVRERPLQKTGLSVHAQRLAALLNEHSENGMTHDPLLSAEEILQVLGITEYEAAGAADELEEQGLVKLHKHIGMGDAGFGRISPQPFLFFITDPYLKGWDPEADAKTMAATIANMGKESISLAEVDKILLWGPRRLNPAADFLAIHNYVQPWKSLGSLPYTYGGLFVTPKTQRFAAA